MMERMTKKYDNGLYGVCPNTSFSDIVKRLAAYEGADQQVKSDEGKQESNICKYAADIRRCAAKDTLTTVDRDMLMDIADRLDGGVA